MLYVKKYYILIDSISDIGAYNALDWWTPRET